VDLATWQEWQRLEAAYDAAFPGRSADPTAALATRDQAEAAYRRAVAAKRGEQCSLLRDIFGNPFNTTTLAPPWLTWHGGLLDSMAQRMYDSRDFSDMPVLADALEEAGCQDQDILGHCRSGGEHVRGCWVVDLLLGKG
jgi:hypothetical protein